MTVEQNKIVNSYTTWTFAWHEFLSKLGLPQDADVLQVRVRFGDGGTLEVVAKDAPSHA